jgi:hypothetical protein
VKRLVQTLALIGGLALRAQDPAAVAAAMARPADAARYPQAGAVVLLDQTVITLDAQGRSTIEGHRLIKILQDRAMRQLSDQRIPYQGDRQICQVLTALTRLPSGEVREPEPNGLMEVSDPEAAAAPFYSSARLKVVSFPAVQIGAVLELKYRISPLPGSEDDRAPDPFMGEQAFGGAEPVQDASLALNVPAGTDLKVQMFNGAPAPGTNTQGGVTTYTWTVRDQPQIVNEAGMVPDDEIVPRVVWTVVKDRAELGRWLYQRFQAAAAPEPAVQAKARELTEGLASPESRLERLALFVTKDIQNVPLGLGRVGYRPTRAGIILANRYADCRDKFVLFQSLVEAVGLTAQPVFIRQVHAKSSDLASLDEYQDILARVPLGSGERYFNLSRNLSRLGQLVAADAGRPGLLVSAAGGQTLTTPRVDEGTQFLRARWDMTLEPGGDLEARIALEFGGLFDQHIRSYLYGRNDADRRVLFQATAGHLKQGAILESFQVSDLLDLTRPAAVSLTVRIPAFGCLQGDMMIVNWPASLMPLGEDPARPALPAMRYPFLVPATCAMDATLALKLPPGYRIAYRPPSAEIRQDPLDFQVASQVQADRLQLRYSLRWQDGVVEPAAYPALWKAFGQTTAPANALVLLEKEK